MRKARERPGSKNKIVVQFGSTKKRTAKKIKGEDVGGGT